MVVGLCVQRPIGRMLKMMECVGMECLQLLKRGHG